MILGGECLISKNTNDAVKRSFPSPGILALFFCCFIAALVYFTHGCDPQAFVLVGEKFALGDPSGTVGYDGQFAYYIAVDPLGAPAYLDDPPYRYQRILYPLLARLLAFGQPALVPWALLFVNIVSISLSTELLARMLSQRGLGPYLAILFPLWLGQIFALRADLNEPLCFLLVLLALWWYERQQLQLSAVALAAGALAKESALLFLPAIILVLLLRREHWFALRYALVGLLPYAALQCGLYLWLGGFGFVGKGAGFERIPFYGFVVTEPPAARIFLVIFFALPVAALLALAVRQLLRTARSVHAWALLTNCLFIIFLTRVSTIDVLAVFRLATGVVVAALLFCAAHRRRRLALLLHAVWLPPSMIAAMIPGFLLRP